MHKYTVDLLNTLDDYRVNNITYEHKDPLIKEQVGAKHFNPISLICLFIMITSITISNFILLYKLNITTLLTFNLYQIIIIISLFSILYLLGEYLRFRKISTKVTLTGSDYIDEVKDYFFYTAEIYECIEVDLEPCFKKMKHYKNFQSNLKNNQVTTQELFEIYTIIHNEYNKRPKYLNKIVKKSDFLDNLKNIRKKELQNMLKFEEDAKDLKKFFSEQSYSGKS